MKTFMPLIFGMLLSLPSLASDCQVEGARETPQVLNCTYRDGWYIKHYLDISCKNGKYEFEQATHIGVFDRGPLKTTYDANTDTFLFETKDELVFSASPKFLNRYQGKMYYPGLEVYSVVIRCRAKRS